MKIVVLGIAALLFTVQNQAFSADIKAAKQIAKTFVLPAVAPAPSNNPTTPDKVALGRKLFFDTRLSIDGTVSCNSCHNVMSSGTDNRPSSVGVGGKIGGRGAPTVFNAAFLSVQFWDGRAPSLEEQAKGPLTNPIEMAMTNHDLVISRINQISGYKAEFAKVFGPKDAVTIDNAAKAIAAYERTLITPNSPFDRWAMGHSSAMSPAAERGFATMVEVGCTSCHSGPAFAGPKLPEGTGFFQKFPTFADNDYVKKYDLLADIGRKNVTGQDSDLHMFRVPTLRNIAQTAPYFHNGKVATLEEAIRVMGKVQLNKDLSDAQVKDIFTFLTQLTGSIPEQKLPRLAETLGTTLTPAQ